MDNEPNEDVNCSLEEDERLVPFMTDEENDEAD